MDNANDYIPVKVKGARKLKITFDELSATENGCDYLKLFKDDTYTEMWGEKYTGGKDGGSSNWPGCGGRPPLIIPANSFVIHFRSDGSVNAWGWKLYITILDGAAQNSTGMSISSVDCCQNTSSFHRLLSDGPAGVIESPQLSSFPILESSSVSTVISPNIQNTVDTSANEKSISQVFDYFGNPLMLLKSKVNENIPIKFVFNLNEEFEFIIRKEANVNSAVVFKSKELQIENLSYSIALANLDNWVHQLESKWVYVTYTSNDVCETGWTLRREDDRLYLLIEKDAREASVSNDSKDLVDNVVSNSDSSGVVTHGEFSYNVKDLVVIENDSNLSTGSSVLSANEHPLCEVQDGPAKNKNNVSSVLSYDVLMGQHEAIENVVSNAEKLSCILIAQDCISLLMEKWPSDTSFSLDIFGGSVENMIKFMKEVFNRNHSESNDGSDDCNNTLVSLKSRLCEVLASMNSADSAPIVKHFVQYCLKWFKGILKPKLQLTPTKALSTKIETKHNYDDNMDQQWDISFPGALYLKIVFDPRSASENGCDYCDILKDKSGKAKWNSRPYTGTGNDKVWAGVFREPPCIVKADNCVVKFHSDSSNNDWGFLLTCYAIMEGPTEEEIELHEKENSLVSKNAAEIDFVCWLLEVLYKSSSTLSVDARNHLFCPELFEILSKCLSQMVDYSKKTCIVHLITALFLELNNSRILPTLPTESHCELVKLQKSIIKTADNMYHSEVNSVMLKGETTAPFSAMMQSLVEACMIIYKSNENLNQNKSEYCLTSYTWNVSSISSLETSDNCYKSLKLQSCSDDILVATCEGLKSTGNAFIHWKVAFSDHQSNEIFEIGVRVANFCVKLNIFSSLLTVHSGTKKEEFSDEIVCIKSGDFISVELNFTDKLVLFYRN